MKRSAPSQIWVAIDVGLDMRNTFGVQGSPVNAERVFQIPRSTWELLKQTTDGACLESGLESFSRRRHESRALKMARVHAESQRNLQTEAALQASTVLT